MSLAAKTQQILALARSRDIEDRERLVLAIAEICDEGPEIASSAPVQALLSSIFMTLVVEAERDIRQRLAERIATAEWAPSALINVLALDDIEIARPIIAQSPVLHDSDLIRLLVEATVEHQVEVARRPRLGSTVVAAILSQEEPAVLTALAGNDSAEVDPGQMRTLVDLSEWIAALRSPLTRHPRLTEDLAGSLYAWVGQALRQSLVARFELDTDALDAALAESVRDAHGGAPHTASVGMGQGDEQEDMERRLIAKLDVAGQLRPGYLLRALREHKLSLFLGGLTTLGRFEPGQLRKAIDSDRPELLALACAAVGIDRSVFPTILEHVRQLNAGRPGGGEDGAKRANGAFGAFGQDIAATAFRHAVAKA